MNKLTVVLSAMAVTMIVCALVGAVVCGGMAIGTSVALPGLGIVVSGLFIAGFTGLGLGGFVGAILGFIVGISLAIFQNPK